MFNIKSTKQEKLGTTIKHFFSITDDAAPNEEIRERLLSSGQVTGTNMVVMICAIIIASVGLNTNSTAVIIGAMLISPLMGSIMATAYGACSVDYYLTRKHLLGFIFQIFISVFAAFIYFKISPIKNPTAELLARTSPTFYDVIIATAGGIAGIIGQTRKEKANNIIPGVAIATALMPPLCTCGYAIANRQWKMLGGASYLFGVNSYFIFLSAVIVLAILKIPKVRELTDAEWRKVKKGMLRNTIIILLPSFLIALSIW